MDVMYAGFAGAKTCAVGHPFGHARYPAIHGKNSL
jgi:hypothetical protein